MSELETLLTKSKDDLVAIGIQFGLVSEEESLSKTRNELISIISNQPIEVIDNYLVGSTKKEGNYEQRNSEPSTEEATTKIKKPTRRKTKANSVSKPSSDITKEETTDKNSEEQSDDSISKLIKPKRGRGSKAKKTPNADSVETISIDELQPEKVEEPASNTKEESEKKPGRKKKKKVEAKSDVKEDKVEASDNLMEDNKEDASIAKPIETVAGETSKPTKRKGSKRRITFGPDESSEETSSIDTKEESTNTSEEVDQEEPIVKSQPEIVYQEISGILSLSNENNRNEFCGFVHKTNYLPGEDDAYVPGGLIKRYGLRKGDEIVGLVVPSKGRYATLKKLVSVNGHSIEEGMDLDILKKRPKFEKLTAIYPDERLTLETDKEDLSSRIIDLFCPIGKGQRGMIVSPPKAGKTILLKKVANSITSNNPDCKVIVLLIDERPEEVTDMQRSIKGEVVYSTFDKKPENHVRVTELVLERAMRLVEEGEDVVILLDSMTRLARAYNLTINPTGRTLSGGLDPGSLYGPKRFFGAARNIEFGGSLTIIATALIETGSRMDEVIFEEFKGTGNMEVVLDRKLADRRVFPAIAVDKSGTRREDLLLSSEELEAVWLTRKSIADVDTITSTEAVLNFMKRTNNNSQFVLSARKSFGGE